jgi:GntR family transcriptional repressor for pyruvate dehydrogenase complex
MKVKNEEERNEQESSVSSVEMSETSSDGVNERVSIDLFGPLVMRKAVDEVVSVLVDAIHGGLLEPGDRFPKEADLAARLDVSRNTINQAMARLQRAGVVSVRRGALGGATVISHSVPSELLMRTTSEEPAEVAQWCEARRPAEMQATLLAAGRLNEHRLRTLRQLVRKLHSLVGDERQFTAVDLRFHAQIGRMSGNALLAEYLDGLMRHFLILRTQFPVGRVGLKRAIENQERSYEALASGDEQQIIAATDQHIGSVEEHFLGRRLPLWLPVDRAAKRRRRAT